MLLITREPRRSAPGTARDSGGGLRAAQRTTEAARLLGAADLTVSALDGGQVTALLAAATDPGTSICATRLAVPCEPVTSPGPRDETHPDAAQPHPPARDQAAGGPVPGPPDVEVATRHLRIGDDYATTLAVTGYPAEVAPGWLEPLLAYPRARSAGSSTPKTNTPASPPAPAAPTSTSVPTAYGSTPSTCRRSRLVPGPARTR